MQLTCACVFCVCLFVKGFVIWNLHKTSWPAGWKHQLQITQIRTCTGPTGSKPILKRCLKISLLMVQANTISRVLATQSQHSTLNHSVQNRKIPLYRFKLAIYENFNLIIFH